MFDLIIIIGALIFFVWELWKLSNITFFKEGLDKGRDVILKEENLDNDEEKLKSRYICFILIDIIYWVFLIGGLFFSSFKFGFLLILVLSIIKRPDKYIFIVIDCILTCVIYYFMIWEWICIKPHEELLSEFVRFLEKLF